jgi:hypothetical protein
VLCWEGFGFTRYPQSLPARVIEVILSSRRTLCERCLAAIKAWAEPALMFQAILYLRAAL